MPVNKTITANHSARNRARGFTLAADSEWDDNRPEPWICTPFCGADGGNAVVYFTDAVPADTRRRLEAAAPHERSEVVFVQRGDDTNFVAGSGCNALAVYSSPRDLEFTFGWNRTSKAYRDGRVKQRDSLVGRVGGVEILDEFGWDKKGFKHLATAVGIPMPDKGLMDRYKTHMWDGLLERPEDFLRYAVADARAVARILKAFVGLVRDVETLLGIPPCYHHTTADVPLTNGRLVADAFEKYLLHAAAGDHTLEVDFCLKKLGVLDPDAQHHARDREAFNSAIDRYTRPVQFETGETPDDDLDDFFKAGYAYTALDACSVDWFTSRARTETASLNALVHGGRCNNEDPFACRIGKGFDVDFSTCYGGTLRSLLYPLGLPTVLSYAPNDRRRLTLGQFLKKLRHHLVPGLYTITVSGKLTFSQDLIYSRLTGGAVAREAALASAGPAAARASLFGFNPYTVGGDGKPNAFPALLRKEIVNGVITADVLDVIDRVATNAERAALMNLEVVTACYYKASDRCATLDDWTRAVMADKGRYETDPRSPAGHVRDTRTRAWYGVPLEGFVGLLVDRRLELKARKKDPALTPDERRQAECLDNVLKIFVNTLYGDLASRFFAVGNVVLANNITARARVGVWMTAKALGLAQCITDGGIYTPWRVPWFRGKKPGLHVLASMWDWHNQERDRVHVRMGGYDWDANWNSLPPPSEWDRMAQEHVRKFWAPYGLTLPFRLEHKPENTFTAAAYWSKADYALETATGRKFALRGKEWNSQKDVKPHPHFTLGNNILDGSDAFPDDLTYTKGGILKVGTWKRAQNSKGFEDLKGLRPGQNLPVAEQTARYNNEHFPLATAADFYRRRYRKKFRQGKWVEWFERYRGKGIRAVLRAMAADELT
jgi:hypothetical protein